MNVLAIDPGTTESAFVLMDGEKILEFGKLPNDEIGLYFRKGLWIKAAVCERIRSYGMAVGAELFETAEWCGYFRREAKEQGIPWHWLTRIEVKNHLCHSSKAKDSNIRAALIDRFGGPLSIKKGGPLYKVAGDEWAALAVALTWWDTSVERAA